MPTVLLCDDELMNRKVAIKILTKEGFSIVEAENGEEALVILKATKIDIILMDLMMPVMDGYETMKIIKNDENISAIPLLVISSLSDKSAIIKALELGADDYLTKPFDITDFRFRVKNAIKIGAYQNILNNKKLLGEMIEYKDNEI